MLAKSATLGPTHRRGRFFGLLKHPAMGLLASNVAAQAITLCLAPFLTRLYGPEAFGILGTVTAIVTVCVPLSTGRLELGIPTARDAGEAFRLLVLCFLWIFFAAIVMATIFWVASSYLETRLTPVLRSYWYFIPIALIFMALYDVLGIEASRRNVLRPLVISKLVQATAGAVSQIGFGLLGWGTIGLLMGFLVNQAAGVSRLWQVFVAGHPAKGMLTRQGLIATLVKYRRYPLVSSWTAFLDASSKWCLQIAFAFLWSPVIAGYIFLADRIVARPLALISSSLLPVFVSRVSVAAANQPSDLRRAFDVTLAVQTCVVLCWAICVTLVAPYLVPKLFGDQWTTAVPYIQVVCWASAPAACQHAVIHSLQMTGRQSLEAAIVLAKVAVLVTILVVSYLNGLPALTTLIYFAIAQVVVGVLTLCAYRRAISQFAIEASSQ